MPDYGYQGGYGGQPPAFTPMMPQPGFPAGDGSVWPSQQQQPQQGVASSGPLPDDAEEGGYRVPRQLAPGSSVPVARCPDGRWAMPFVMNGGEFHTVVYVQVMDGSFAPYHLEGMGALRIAWDVPAGEQPYLTRASLPTGKPPHVLHLPENEGISGID